MIWKSDEDGVTLFSESVDMVVDYGVSLSAVRARTRAFYRIVNLPDRGKAKQTRVTAYQYFDGGGFLPASLVNRKLPVALNIIQEAIDEFRTDTEIDDAEREELATFMRERHGEQVYSQEVRTSEERSESYRRLCCWR